MRRISRAPSHTPLAFGIRIRTRSAVAHLRIRIRVATFEFKSAHFAQLLQLLSAVVADHRLVGSGPRSFIFALKKLDGCIG